MKKILAIIFISGVFTFPSKGQLAPMKSQFFQNPYLVNPAMAGHENKTSIYANYSNQWNKIDGSPVLMSLSAATPLNNNASLGLNIINDRSGLLTKTQAMGSFSYRIPFSEDHNLRLGVSLTWAQDRIGLASASGSAAADPTVNNANRRKSYLDGNFGLTYQLSGLEAQFSYLNLNQSRFNEVSTVDYATFYSSLRYLIPMDGWTVKPLFVLRGIKGYDNQWDAAAEWKVTELSFYTMYHSNQSFTGGLGYDYKSSLFVSAYYNTEPANTRGFSGGIFDLVVGYRF